MERVYCTRSITFSSTVLYCTVYCTGQISIIVRVRSVRLPVHRVWRDAVVDVLGGVDHVGLDELRAAVSSLQRGRSHHVTSYPSSTCDAASFPPSPTATAPRDRAFLVDGCRSKDDAGIPPAPPPSPLNSCQPPSLTAVTVSICNAESKVSSFVRSLFCCCCRCCSCERETKSADDDDLPATAEKMSPDADENTQDAYRLLVNGNNTGNSGGQPGESESGVSTERSFGIYVCRPIQLATGHWAHGPAGNSLAIESLEKQTDKVGTGASTGLDRTSRKAEEESMRVVKLASGYVEERRREFYDSLVAMPAVDDQPEMNQRGKPTKENVKSPAKEQAAAMDNGPRTKLVMYFEQRRGVLVLSVDHFRFGDDGEESEDGEIGVAVACICTQREQVDRLRRDLINGRLADDLTATVGIDEVSSTTTTNGASANGGQPEAEIIVDVAVDMGELDVAQAELT